MRSTDVLDVRCSIAPSTSSRITTSPREANIRFIRVATIGSSSTTRRVGAGFALRFAVALIGTFSPRRSPFTVDLWKGKDKSRSCVEKSGRSGRVAARESTIDVAEIAPRSDGITHLLLELLDRGEPAIVRAGPEAGAVHVDFEDAPARRHQTHGPEVFPEGAEQLLGVPGGAKHPVALCAVDDRDRG